MIPQALFRHTLTVSRRYLPAKVSVTAWGTPKEQAKHILFYFGGMPTSAYEIPLHSLVVGVDDLYRERQLHVVVIDKPGMGQTSLPSYHYSLKRDWPELVRLVADHYGMERYGVFGISNGGPYVMACLTHEATRQQVCAATVIVGVSDVWASGYSRHVGGFCEGVYNSLPLLVTGPLNCLLFGAGNLALRLGGYERLVQSYPTLQTPEAKELVRNLVADCVYANAGLGSALDCQQGLSPLYARTKEVAIAEFSSISCPVALWYGGKDSSVPVPTAEWLQEQIPNSVLHVEPESTHALYLDHAEVIMDEMVQNCEAKADTSS